MSIDRSKSIEPIYHARLLIPFLFHFISFSCIFWIFISLLAPRLCSTSATGHNQDEKVNTKLIFESTIDTHTHHSISSQQQSVSLLLFTNFLFFFRFLNFFLSFVFWAKLFRNAIMNNDWMQCVVWIETKQSKLVYSKTYIIK